jgi:hypothetical protein
MNKYVPDALIENETKISLFDLIIFQTSKISKRLFKLFNEMLKANI